jgi:hypothetical protein
MNNWPIRKIYLYLVCSGAMFMIVVGAVTGFSSLLESIIKRSSFESGYDTYTLTFSFSMLLVGAIVWYVHWRMIKKDNQ